MQNISTSDSQNKSWSTQFQLHGVLVRVLNAGVLLVGESGIGKSESALDLLAKGHQLVADDVVEVSVTGNEVQGRAPELTAELLEIRGLGILNVRELFGDGAVCKESAIELCVELQKWQDVERIGNPVHEHVVAGRAIPKFVLPVNSGRNLSTLIETAARLFINRHAISDANRILVEKHIALLDSMRQV
jgi:HPr kinase/phosphorylase